MIEPGLSNLEFVGYTFQGSPPKVPRLWFLDRHLDLLFVTFKGTMDINVGFWTGDILNHETEDIDLFRPLVRFLPAGGTEAMAWEMTGNTIEHIHTFGRDDDVWRLGVWPD